MTLTPAIKGQLTKATNQMRKENAGMRDFKLAIRGVFLRHMPRQQAKHATRKYLATIAR